MLVWSVSQLAVHLPIAIPDNRPSRGDVAGGPFSLRVKFETAFLKFLLFSLPSTFTKEWRLPNCLSKTRPSLVLQSNGLRSNRVSTSWTWVRASLPVFFMLTLEGPSVSSALGSALVRLRIKSPCSLPASSVSAVLLC